MKTEEIIQGLRAIAAANGNDAEICEKAADLIEKLADLDSTNPDPEERWLAYYENKTSED